MSHLLYPSEFYIFGTLVNHFIYYPKLLCLLCSHKEISFQCSGYLFDGLTGMTMVQTIQCIPSFQYFSCMNFDITCLALSTAGRLVAVFREGNCKL